MASYIYKFFENFIYNNLLQPSKKYIFKTIYGDIYFTENDNKLEIISHEHNILKNIHTITCKVNKCDTKLKIHIENIIDEIIIFVYDNGDQIIFKDFNSVTSKFRPSLSIIKNKSNIRNIILYISIPKKNSDHLNDVESIDLSKKIKIILKLTY
ncbi:hypothetical protein AHEV_229 [Adoxophyes honmai entomopoxvirus 'L']|uniref:Uncharacterized protein n=1 Tax=Adoxophyes honmai entomopoxvirus 'L' TaxID=1293540 RepID=A0A916KPA8_9POXV|nr:hypothetical protein AHEV_229 [Adoxophyes honmai entomopoxvirus 'L']CCU55550.1 hypothetical protein AHEV_229 [Adoxophyes honmai entomopoxvirus 'L']